MNTILITGGCGFIGTSLIAQLLKGNPDINIRVFDSFLTGTPEDLAGVTNFSHISQDELVTSSGVVLVQGDIRDKEAAIRCAEGVDCIVHLAANTGVGPSVDDPRLDMESNVGGTFNMLEAARLNGVKRFVFASSGAPAGEVEPPIHEEMPPHPVSPYGASKLAGEGYCSAYSRTFDIDTVCLRFGNVYGPLSKKKSSVVAKFIRQALAGEKCVIFGDGSQTRDFLYIDDLVQAAIKAITVDGIGGETFQIATGMESTIGDIAEVIKEILEKNGQKMEIVYDSPRLGDVLRNYSDTSKAKAMLGWKPTQDLRNGVQKTVDYFLSVGDK